MRLLHHFSKLFLMLAFFAPLTVAGERPTCNKETCDPRPDILPYWLHDWHEDYRQVYNRPRYWPGRIAHTIEPTSQEAMVWCEANQMGLYRGKDCPPAYKQYNYPKPWEVLQTGPRPDFKKPNPLAVQPVSKASSGADTEGSPSDKSSRVEQAKPISTEGSEAPTPKSNHTFSLIQPARAYRLK